MIDVSGRPICLGLFELYKYGGSTYTAKRGVF